MYSSFTFTNILVLFSNKQYLEDYMPILTLDKEDALVKTLTRKYGSNFSIECTPKHLVVKVSGLSMGGLYIAASNIMSYEQFSNLVSIDPTYHPDKMVASSICGWLVSQARKHGVDTILQYGDQIKTALHNLLSTNENVSLSQLNYSDLLQQE